MEARLRKEVGRFEIGLRVYEGDDGRFKLGCLEFSFDDWGNWKELLRVTPEKFVQLLDELKESAVELERRGRQVRDLLAGSDIFYVEDVEN